MKRRTLCLGALTAATTLGAAGCRERGTTLHPVDPDIGRKNVPETIAVLLAVLPGRSAELLRRLEDHAFAVPTPGVHYARMLVLPSGELLLSAVFDDDLGALVQLLANNAARVDPILSLTAGYPSGGAAARFELKGWLRKHEAKTMLLYSAFSRASEPAVREAIGLRTEFLRLVQATQREPAAAEHAYTRFLRRNRSRIDTHREAAVDQLSPAALTAPQSQNSFTMVFDLSPHWIKRLDKTLTDGEWLLDHLHIHPLKKIPTVHYARFGRITETRILFESVFDGDWPQYVADFAVNIPTQLDLVWGGAVGYPKGGAKDAAALGAFLEDKKIPRDYFYMAYADATVKDIQASLVLGRKLVRFSDHAPAAADQLVAHVRRFVDRHQGLLA